MAYRIEYSKVSEEHLRALTARNQRIVLDTVDAQLIYQPAVPTRNRKKMRPNPVAPWELRVGNLRVYYDVIEEPEQVVQILAMGLKRGSQVLIGGIVVELKNEDD